DGERLLVLGHSSVTIYDATGTLIGSSPTTGASVAAAFAPSSHRFALVVGPVVLLVDGDTVRFPNRPIFTGAVRLGNVAWSPDGRWLLISWPSADQLVFRRIAPAKLYAVSNVAAQFSPGATAPSFPRIAGWCC